MDARAGEKLIDAWAFRHCYFHIAASLRNVNRRRISFDRGLARNVRWVCV